LEGILYQGVEGFVYWLRCRPEPMVVLVVDQFEELFTLASKEDRERFLDLLLGAIAYASDKFKLVITLRADFIAACLESPINSLLQQASVLVPPKLSNDDYRCCIVNPAQQVGLKVESGLVEFLLQELNHSSGDLPLLEFVLEQLYSYRVEGELTLQAYQKHLGGMAGALERKAQAVYDSLDAAGKECARWIFLSLTQLGEGTSDTRRRVFKSDLVVKKYPALLVEQTLQVLTTAKLIVVNLEDEVTLISKGDTQAPELLPAAVTIEVAHEILIRHWSTLRWWLEENRTHLRLLRQIEQATALWKQNQEQSDFLLQGVRLGEAEEIFIKYTDELSHDVQRFIAACLDERQRQGLEVKKRLRQAQRAIAVISVLGIASFGFGGVAYWQKQAAQVREINALNASSQAMLLSNQQLEAVIASLKAGRQLKQMFAPSKDLQLETVTTLQQAISQTQEINRLQLHSASVNAIAFNSDTLASVSDDSTVKLWSSDGRLIRSWQIGDRVLSLALASNQILIGTTKNIQLYSFDGTLLHTFTGHNDWVTAVAFHPNGKIIASAGRDRTVKLWQNKTLIKSWNAHNGWVNTISFSPDGMIASGGEDNLIKIWDRNGKLIKTYSGHGDRITRLAFHGKILASASGDKTIKLWQDKLLQTIDAHNDQVNSVFFTPDGKLISGSADRTVKIWDLDGNLLTTLKGHGAEVKDVSMSGNIIASASMDKSIKLWQINISKPKSSIYSVTFSADGKLAVSAGWDGNVNIQRVDTWKSQVFQADDSPILAIDISRDGQIATAAGQKIKLWNLNNQLLQTFTGHTDIVTSVAFSLNRQHLASGSDDKTIKLWRLRDGKLMQTLSGHQDGVTSVAFSPDSQTLATSSHDGTVKLWRVVDGKFLKTLQDDIGGNVTVVKFSPNGNILASTSSNNNIHLWNIADNTLIKLTGHTQAVNSLSFSSDNQILISGSADNTIKFWNLGDGTLVKTLLGHPGKINSLSLSPDGKTLLTGGEDAGVTLWNLNLDTLMQQGCNRVDNYLRSLNVVVSEHDTCKNFSRSTFPTTGISSPR
jgi:WD40 repeat protein